LTWHALKNWYKAGFAGQGQRQYQAFRQGLLPPQTPAAESALIPAAQALYALAFKFPSPLSQLIGIQLFTTQQGTQLTMFTSRSLL
jgi:hypothetical protein